MLEIEKRAFITEEQSRRLIRLFSEEGEPLGEDEQETHYLDCDEDLRIQKGRGYAKLWLKGGRLHDDSRQEIEAFCSEEDFAELSRILEGIGLQSRIIWYRKRHRFRWRGVKATVDHTRGYGHILELEIQAEEEGDCKQVLEGLFGDLGIRITPKEEFQRRYEHYKANWRDILNS
jgi:predicted adenylyl cyclase CyaB